MNKALFIKLLSLFIIFEISSISPSSSLDPDYEKFRETYKKTPVQGVCSAVAYVADFFDKERTKNPLTKDRFEKIFSMVSTGSGVGEISTKRKMTPQEEKLMQGVVYSLEYLNIANGLDCPKTILLMSLNNTKKVSELRDQIKEANQNGSLDRAMAASLTKASKFLQKSEEKFSIQDLSSDYPFLNSNPKDVFPSTPIDGVISPPKPTQDPEPAPHNTKGTLKKYKVSEEKIVEILKKPSYFVKQGLEIIDSIKDPKSLKDMSEAVLTLDSLLEDEEIRALKKKKSDVEKELPKINEKLHSKKVPLPKPQREALEKKKEELLGDCKQLSLDLVRVEKNLSKKNKENLLKRLRSSFKKDKGTLTPETIVDEYPFDLLNQILTAVESQKDLPQAQTVIEKLLKKFGKKEEIMKVNDLLKKIKKESLKKPEPLNPQDNNLKDRLEKCQLSELEAQTVLCQKSPFSIEESLKIVELIQDHEEFKSNRVQELAFSILNLPPLPLTSGTLPSYKKDISEKLKKYHFILKKENKTENNYWTIDSILQRYDLNLLNKILHAVQRRVNEGGLSDPHRLAFTLLSKSPKRFDCDKDIIKTLKQDYKFSKQEAENLMKGLKLDQKNLILKVFEKETSEFAVEKLNPLLEDFITKYKKKK